MVWCLWVVSEAGVGLRDYAPAWFGLELEVRSRHFTWKLRLAGEKVWVSGAGGMLGGQVEASRPLPGWLDRGTLL